MRAIWKGHISFGLVNIPVALFPAEQRTDLQLHMIDSRNFSRVRYERVNAETGEEVPWDQIVKGYEFDDGSYVVINQEDLKAAAPESTQTIEIESFVDLNQIDLVYFDKPYYLAPAKKGDKGYALLRQTLRQTGKAGIARVVIRTRQYIAALVAREDALILNLLRYRQELRDTADLDLPGDDVEVSDKELKMARTLVEAMAGDWDPEAYQDEYRDALMKWINERIEAGEIEASPEAAEREPPPPAPINLMEALKKSLEEKGKRTGAKAAAKKAGGKKAKKTTKKAG